MSGPSEATTGDIARVFLRSVESRRTLDAPYRHFFLENILPDSIARDLASLPIGAPELGDVSGRREIHNETRSYFDAANMRRFPAMARIAEAFQHPDVVRAIHAAFGAPIDDTFLRLEYALDIDGFWLEPHTDLGVKKFTCLLYLSEGHGDLGTDIYWNKERRFGVSPFRPNSAMIFVPSDITWHGFEKRPIEGVRKSVIFNYVTHEWRAREQLSFPDAPVRL